MEKIEFNTEERYLPYEENLKRGFTGGMGALLFFFLMLPMALAVLLPRQVAEMPGTVIGVTLVSQLGVGLATLAFLAGGRPLSDVLELGAWKEEHLRYGVLGGAVMIFVTAGVQMAYLELTRRFGIDLSGESTVERLIGQVGWPGMVLLAVTAIIVAPLTEEIFFRRVLFGFLAGRMAWVPALAVSSLAFGLIHADVRNLPGLIALGAGFQLMYVWRKSLYPAIIMHVTNNVFAMGVTIYGKYFLTGDI